MFSPGTDKPLPGWAGSMSVSDSVNADFLHHVFGTFSIVANAEYLFEYPRQGENRYGNDHNARKSLHKTSY
jgi:hypothetical protein